MNKYGFRLRELGFFEWTVDFTNRVSKVTLAILITVTITPKIRHCIICFPIGVGMRLISLIRLSFRMRIKSASKLSWTHIWVKLAIHEPLTSPILLREVKTRDWDIRLDWYFAQAKSTFQLRNWDFELKSYCQWDKLQSKRPKQGLKIASNGSFWSVTCLTDNIFQILTKSFSVGTRTVLFTCAKFQFNLMFKSRVVYYM